MLRLYSRRSREDWQVSDGLSTSDRVQVGLHSLTRWVAPAMLIESGLGGKSNSLSLLQGLLPLYFAFEFFALGYCRNG